jgi:hypothetical protein
METSDQSVVVSDGTIKLRLISRSEKMTRGEFARQRGFPLPAEGSWMSDINIAVFILKGESARRLCLCNVPKNAGLRFISP